MVIMNLGNGFGSVFNSDYVVVVDELCVVGGWVIGYVYICYGVNYCILEVLLMCLSSEVLVDVQKYVSWYGVDGVFFDEMVMQLVVLFFYQVVSDGLCVVYFGWQIVGNFGVVLVLGYIVLVNMLMSFEGLYVDFVNGFFLGGLMDVVVMGVIVYDVVMVVQMQQVMGLVC